MLRRTLLLELESGKTLKLRSTEEGLEVTLGKAKALLSPAEVQELQGALREVAGGPVVQRQQVTQPPRRDNLRGIDGHDDVPTNPQ